MRRIILAIFAFIFCLLWAEVKVETVLETTSIKEYNQWVKHNKARYPTLEHIKISSEVITWGEEYKIYYYNANGDVFNEEILKAGPGMWLSVDVYENAGRVVSIESPRGEGGEGVEHLVSAKGPWGNITCSFVGGAGLFIIPSIGFFNLNKKTGTVEILNWEGRKVGEFIGNADYYEYGRMEYVSTPDNKYLLLSFMMGSSYAGLWQEKEGVYHELWRKSLKSYVFLSISNDGQYACIGDSGCVLVYNSNGNLVYSYCFPKRGRTNPISDFSPDGNFLICALSSQMSLIDNKTGRAVWEISVSGDEFVRQVFFVKNGEYIVLTHISIAKAYIYDLQGTLQGTINGPTLGCSVVGDMIILDHREKEFHKTIYRIEKE